MHSTRGLVVHVIDDNSAVRGGFARLLRSAALEVRAYETMESFLRQIDQAAPGCIVMDVTMPDLAGPEAIARLRAVQTSLPIIVVSGRDNESVHAFVDAVGARMFLRKPVDDQALLDAISWVTKVRVAP